MKAAVSSRLLVLLAFVVMGTTAQAQDTLSVAASDAVKNLLSEAEALIAAGDSQRAYGLLSGRESDLSGNAYFDYLLGVAALDAGRRSEAILALRRAVAEAPEFSGARMELARALFESGEFGEARRLFTALLDENPPQSARIVIDEYLTAIESRPGRIPGRLSNYVEVFFGYDSNANGSTDSQQFLGFALNPENLETDSAFIDVAAGLDLIKPTSASFAWLAGARAGFRNNPDATFVDAGILSGQAGATWRTGRFYGRASVDGYAASRDGESNENYGGGNLLLGLQLGQRFDLSVTARSGALRYGDEISILDVDRTLYTLALGTRFASRGRFTVELIDGEDDQKESASPYGNSKSGGRVSLGIPLGARHYLFASLGELESEYDGLFFGLPREDSQLTSLLQLEFRDVGMEGLTIAPRLRYVNNDSDISLYDYDRLEAGIMIRWVAK